MKNTYAEISFEIMKKEGAFDGIKINTHDVKFKHHGEMVSELFVLDENSLEKYCGIKCETAQTVYDTNEVSTLSTQLSKCLS